MVSNPATTKNYEQQAGISRTLRPRKRAVKAKRGVGRRPRRTCRYDKLSEAKTKQYHPLFYTV